MTTNTTNSQAASIDTPEFLALMVAWGDCAPGNEAGKLYDSIVAHIDAKLAQAFNDGAIEGRIHQRGIDAARIEVVESRLAEIQRGVEGLTRYDAAPDRGDGIWSMAKGDYLDREDVLALLAPQGQASDTSGLPG